MQRPDTNKQQADGARFPYGGRSAVLFLGPAILLAFSDAPPLLALILYPLLWVLAVTDWHTGRLPNLWTALLLVTGLLVNSQHGIAPYHDYVIGALAGFGSLFLLGLFYKTVRKRDGLGMGDAKFMAGCGAWLGWQFLPVVLLIASVTALLYVGMRWCRGLPVDMKIRLPFGPFLCVSTWLVWLFSLS